MIFPTALRRIGFGLCLALVPLGCEPAAPSADSLEELRELAGAALPQVSGTLAVSGLLEPVEVRRDPWGIPHIYANNTPDLFFAQGYVVAQDRMWQLEMWRRNGEGKLAEVLGEDYVTRDRFARLLQFRGDWEEEMRMYHPEGPVIFDAFARGVNAAIRAALEADRVPVEFHLMDFQPEPAWTAQTVLTRMPGWTLSRNASSEVNRAIRLARDGVAWEEEINPTRPARSIEIPEGLDLEDIVPEILEITQGANNIRWNLLPDLGSNNWVVSGARTETGMPLLANDPHREVVNPALRYVVHLNAPGWNALGATEPGLPGISIGHNDRIGWGFTILGMDQQDLYVEETNPENPDQYLYRGEWYDMEVYPEEIRVKGSTPVTYAARYTRQGPVLHAEAARNRAYSLRWVGALPGGAGYLGSLNVMQARNWEEFNAGIAKSWFIPSHSLVYADVDGNIGYRGVAYTPIREGWDGLLPVPAKDGLYEWKGFVPFDVLPMSFNRSQGWYASANNDVVPFIVPDFDIPLGYEYSAPDRFDRIVERLRENRRFSVSDMEGMQQDAFSIRARQLVPLLRGLQSENAEVQRAIEILLEWDFVLDRNSTAAAVFEYWLLGLPPHASRPRLPEARRERGPFHSIESLLPRLVDPDAPYGSTREERVGARDQILLAGLADGLELLTTVAGRPFEAVVWGDLHTSDFVHPLGHSGPAAELFRIEPVRRSGSGYTVLQTSSPSATQAKQLSGASFKFVFDLADWDRSTGLSTPGQSAQPLSPHYADLAEYWGEGRYFPLFFSRERVEENTSNLLTLEPAGGL